jgi:hypothetical protein
MKRAAETGGRPPHKAMTKKTGERLIEIPDEVFIKWDKCN